MNIDNLVGRSHPVLMGGFQWSDPLWRRLNFCEEATPSRKVFWSSFPQILASRVISLKTPSLRNFTSWFSIYTNVNIMPQSAIEPDFWFVSYLCDILTFLPFPFSTFLLFPPSMPSCDSLLSLFDGASCFPPTSLRVASLARWGLDLECILSPPEIEGLLIVFDKTRNQMTLKELQRVTSPGSGTVIHLQ
jgi:hypothetical protein